MRHLITIMLVIVAIIHLLPLSGVAGSEKLSTLYGLDFSEPNLSILMRHRAVLFGVLGVFFAFAAFKPAYQPLALIAGFVSALSFLWLAWSTGNYNPQVARVFTADIIALACLLIAAIAYFYMHKK